MAEQARRPGPPWAWRFVLGVVMGMLRVLFGWRVRAQLPAESPDPATPLVVVYNHTSNVDPFPVADAVWRLLGHWAQPLAKAELFDVPVFGPIALAAGGIPVHRGQDAGREAAYADAIDRLHEGGTLLIAPEGTRTHDGTLLPLRHGAARLALEAGVDLLVVTHFGAQRGFSPVVRLAERDVIVTMTMDVVSPWPGEDAQQLTGRIAAVMLDRSQQLQAQYPQADHDARWWPPYDRPGSPTATARENLEHYRESMAEAVANARERMARFAEEHEVDQRVSHARERAEELAARSRERAEHFGDLTRQRFEELSDRARERAAEHGWPWPEQHADDHDADEPEGGRGKDPS